MSRKKNHTDEAFKESLKQYQAIPPEGVWEGVTESLNADKRKARIVWMGRIAAAALILVAAGSTWLWVERSSQDEIGKVERVENQEISAEGQIDNEQDMGNENSSIPEQSSNEQLPGAEPPGAELPGTESSDAERPGTELPGAESPGSNSPAEQSREDQFPESQLAGQGVDMRMNGISRYKIPVKYSDVSSLQAMHTTGRQMESIPGQVSHVEPLPGEGIDVFEEFGDEKLKDYSKWAVGGQATPLYSYRNIESSGESAFNSYSSTQNYNDYESGMLSYAGGVNVNYSPAKRFSLQSGIYYSRQGMSITNSYVTSYGGQSLSLSLPNNQLELNNSTGDIRAGSHKSNSVISNLFGRFQDSETYVDSESPANLGPGETPEITTGDVLQQFEYLEIPLVARYRVIDRRLGLNLLGGLSTNFLVGNNVYFQEGENKEYIGETMDIEPINYSSVVGIGLQYSINRNFYINMEPTFRYYLNSINTGSGLKSHPYSLGFFTGISYSF